MYQIFSQDSTDFSFIGKAIDAIIEISNTLPTTAKDLGDEIWKNGAITIFKPIKVKIIANPYFNLLNIWMKLANKKYKALRPKMAKMFEV